MTSDPDSEADLKLTSTKKEGSGLEVWRQLWFFDVLVRLLQVVPSSMIVEPELICTHREESTANVG